MEHDAWEDAQYAHDAINHIAQDLMRVAHMDLQGLEDMILQEPEVQLGLDAKHSGGAHGVIKGIACDLVDIINRLHALQGDIFDISPRDDYDPFPVAAAALFGEDVDGVRQFRYHGRPLVNIGQTLLVEDVEYEVESVLHEGKDVWAYRIRQKDVRWRRFELGSPEVDEG